MKKLISILLSLLVFLTVLPAYAEEIIFTDDLAGVYCYPEDADEASARYVYRYRYPQLAGDSDLALTINNIYQYAVSDMLVFEAPMQATEVREGSQKVVSVDYEITCQNADYLSVRITKTVTLDGYVSSVISGHVFSLTGSSAGDITSLPYMLGLLKASDTDEWLLNRQTAKADNCVRQMIWEVIEGQMVRGDTGIYPDMTREEFDAGFYPEEDFYLNEDGDFVFFFQQGSIAEEEQGVLLYTITMEDLLDEL